MVFDEIQDGVHRVTGQLEDIRGILDDRERQCEVCPPQSGTGKRLENGQVTPMEVKAGDRVLFGKYSGTEIKLDGEELLILREDEILELMGDDFIAELIPLISKLNGMQWSSVLAQVRDMTVRPRRSS